MLEILPMLPSFQKGLAGSLDVEHSVVLMFSFLYLNIMGQQLHNYKLKKKDSLAS